MPMYKTICALAFIGLASCAPEQVSTAAAENEAAAEAGPGTVTGILNAGVSAELGTGDTPVKFLFDPLYDDHFGSLEPLDDALIDRIVGGEAPYDGVTAVFVSHAHGDHFSERHLNRLMEAQPEVRLIAPAQAVEAMRGAEGWDPAFAARIEAVSIENGEQGAPIEIAGATIEPFRSPHNGWPDRHADVHNITYRVTAASGPDGAHRIMHLGDAAPGTEYFEPHAEFLSSSRTGLAIVPFWFLNADNPESLIDETLNSESAVGMHVPVEEPGWLAGSGFDYFSGEGQQVEVAETASE